MLGRVIFVPKAFCKPGWKLRLGLFLSLSALTATTALIPTPTTERDGLGELPFQSFVSLTPLLQGWCGGQDSKSHSVAPAILGQTGLGSNLQIIKSHTLALQQEGGSLLGGET